MSRPASAPTGLGVAGFRAGVARGARAATPALRLWLGRTAPGDYHSPFPARLRAARAAIVVLAAVWLAAGFVGWRATRSIVQTIGHDTAPSVAAAEAIRTGLSAANADYALAMLSDEGLDGPSLSAMRSRLGDVRTAIVDAAVNVTYGEEERGPILRVLQGLSDYEELIGWSNAKSGDARRDLAFGADDLLHRTAMPAAEALEKVNADHSAEAYRDYLGRWPIGWIVTAGLLLTGGLVAVQVDVARTTRRLLNPGLASATLAVAAATVLVVLRLLAAQADLRHAKLDAFDSVSALSAAKALAADADAAQSFEVLSASDAPRSARYRIAVASLSMRLLGTDGPSAVRGAQNGKAVPGYLGDELSNTTFPGEREAAFKAVTAWNTVVTGDAVLRDALSRGDAALAVGTKTAGVPASLRTSLARFDDALNGLLDINRREFAALVGAAERDDAPLGAVLVAGFVLAVAAAWFGIGRRLDEYRF